ncbi:uncharacterized protein [Arachis hypogaea]|uniref:uncharacterized protein n=1 Tax=Arachis hypogaea TaxID=3818 RepID=UPI003B20D8E4
MESTTAGMDQIELDGSALSNPGAIGCGVILRNDEGRWIAGFSHKLDIGMAFTTELYDRKKCLDLAWAMSFRKIVVEVDVGTVVKLLNEGENLSFHLNTLVREIYEYMSHVIVSGNLN